MEQNLSQIHNYIKERFNDLLDLPNRIQRVNANLILKEWLKIKNLRAWQEMLLEQAQTFNGLSSITWGGADGGSVGIARYPTESGYRFSIKNNQTDENLTDGSDPHNPLLQVCARDSIRLIGGRE